MADTTVHRSVGLGRGSGLGRRASVAAVLGLVALLALGPVTQAQEGLDATALPRPDLQLFEEEVHDQLEEARAQFDALTGDPATAGAELAAAAGALGQLYAMYGLREAAVGALAYASTEAPGEFRWRYFLGLVYEGSGDLERAAESLARAHQLRPDYAPTVVHLGDVEMSRNRQGDAEAWFRRALELEPELDAARFGLGRLASERGEHQQARELFEAILGRQPEASVVHYQLALVYRELGDTDRARSHLDRRGNQNVKLPDPVVDELARLNRGTALLMKQGTQQFEEGHYEKAAAMFRQALINDPEDLPALRALATTLGRAGATEAAIDAHRALLARQPDDASAHYNLGTLLASVGADEEAIAHLERAVEVQPDHQDALYNLAAALERAGRFDETEQRLTALADLLPHDSSVRVDRARVRFILGRRAQARADLEEIVARESDHPEANLALGNLLAAEGDAVAAFSHLNIAAERAADDETRAGASFALGNLLAASRDPASALPYYETAATLAPSSGEARLALATTLGQLGRFSAAADAFAAVLALDPGHESALFGHAMALMLAERYPEALAAFEEAAARLRGNLGVEHALARLLATCPDDAVRDGSRALELAHRLEAVQARLEFAQTEAMALAELGRFEAAVSLQERLLSEARAAGRGDLVTTLESQLDQYRRREPIRAPWR